jgi:hypothetical protein
MARWNSEESLRIGMAVVGWVATAVSFVALTSLPCYAQAVIVPFGSGGYKYTTSAPSGDFSDPAFNDSAWSSGSAPFGYPSGTNCFSFIASATVWPEFQQIWARKTIFLTGSGTHQLQISVRHDDRITGTVPPGWLTQFFTRGFTTSTRQACGPVETYKVTGSSPTFTIALAGAWTVSPAGFLYFSNYMDVQVVDLGLVPPTLSIGGGNSQTAQTGQLLPSSLVVKTTDTAGSAVNNIPISFQITTQPAGAQGAGLSTTSATTQSGTASTQLTLGTVPGQYQVTASCPTCTPTSVVFSATATGCQANDDSDRISINFTPAPACGNLTCPFSTTDLPGGDGKGCLLKETALDSHGVKFQLWCGKPTLFTASAYMFYKVGGGQNRLVGKCWFYAGQNVGEIEKSGSNACYISSRWINSQNDLSNCVERDPPFPGAAGGLTPPDCRTDRWVYEYSVNRDKTTIRVIKDATPVFFQDPPAGSDFNSLPPVLTPNDYPSAVGDEKTAIGLPCDLDFNGKCDALDLLAYRNTLGKCQGDPAYNPLADANEDGCVTRGDGKVLFASMGDVDGDGFVDCTDVRLVTSALGKKSGQTGFNVDADLNRDGVVDVRDLVIVSKNLPAGTRCQ